MILTSISCPQERRIANHQEKTGQSWADPEYQANEAEFLRENPICHYCGRPSTVAHHDEDWMYATKEAYYDLEHNGTPACGTCHWMYRRGYVVCPVCLAAGEVHYMVKGSDSCHLHRARHGGKLRHHRHSCDWNRGNQRCGNPLRRDRICPYSSRDAKQRCDPDHFMARKVAAVSVS